MRIRMKYFGVLAQRLDRQSDVLEVTEGITVDQVLLGLYDTCASLADMNLKVAINAELIHDYELKLAENDEVVLLPPYAGG